MSVPLQVNVFYQALLTEDFFATICAATSAMSIKHVDKRLYASNLIKLIEDLEVIIDRNNALRSKKNYIVYLRQFYDRLGSGPFSASDFIVYGQADDTFRDFICKVESIRQQYGDNAVISKALEYIRLGRVLRTIANTYGDLITYYETLDSNNNVSLLNALRDFKDIVSAAVSKLESINMLNDNEKLSDYLVLGLDDEYIDRVVDNLIMFLSERFSLYRTGYELLDTAWDGIESSSIYVISGPTNHCKSIFMINIARNFIINNKQIFKDKDAIVFITLEDNIYKLYRRIIPIFGNYETKSVKDFFLELSVELQDQKYQNENGRIYAKSTLGKVLTELYRGAMKEVTGDLYENGIRVYPIIKHSPEGTFSPTDLRKFIDALHIEGYNVKAIFLDYIDVMAPDDYNIAGNEYLVQGNIMHSLKSIAQEYGIPVVTITQNNKAAEDTHVSLSNTLVGDSYRKVRYSDYWVQIRQRPDDSIYHTDLGLKLQQIQGTLGTDFTKETDIYNRVEFDIEADCVLVEARVTKAKDAERDLHKYLLFNKRNCRIYDDIVQLYRDMATIKVINYTALQQSVKVHLDQSAIAVH